MSVPPLGQLPIVIETERAAPEVSTQYQYCAVRRVVRMTPATDRM